GSHFLSRNQIASPHRYGNPPEVATVNATRSHVFQGAQKMKPFVRWFCGILLPPTVFQSPQEPYVRARAPTPSHQSDRPRFAVPCGPCRTPRARHSEICRPLRSSHGGGRQAPSLAARRRDLYRNSHRERLAWTLRTSPPPSAWSPSLAA